MMSGMPTSQDSPYQVFHNLDASFSRPYRPGDALVAGFCGLLTDGTTDVHRLAEQVFVRHNRDDRPDGREAPSLSVGDVVVVRGRALGVDRIGFVDVELAVADVVEGSYRDAVARRHGAGRDPG